MTTSAAAAPRASVYTSIENRACRFDPIGHEPGDDEAQTKRCRGLAGMEVIVDAGGTRTGLGFAWPGRRPPVRPVRQVVVGWSVGQKLEWRGGGTGDAARPDAVIVRVIFVNPDDDSKHQVLGILHVDRGAACLIGTVDMTADPHAYDTARRVADTTGPAFVCNTDTSAVEGRATKWTALMLSRALRDGE